MNPRTQPLTHHELNRITGASNYLRELGLSQRETADYNVVRAIKAAMTGHAFEEEAPIEAAASKAIAQRLGIAASKPFHFYVPYEIQNRDLTAGIGSAGGYLVSTETAPGETFISALTAASVGNAMGIEEIDGLLGNVALPSIETGIAASWRPNETSAVTEGNVSFGQRAGVPKTVGAYCEVSGQLLKQSTPAAERSVLKELARSVAAAADLGMVAGSGAAGQPTGIVNTLGVGAVTGTSLDWADICDMVYTVRNPNGIRDPLRLGFVGAPNVEQLLAKRGRSAAAGDGFIWDGDRIGSRPALASNSVPSGTLVLGDWSSVIRLSWGTLEIGVNPFAGFHQGLVALRALWTCDFVLKNPQSFVVAASIT